MPDMTGPLLMVEAEGGRQVRPVGVGEVLPADAWRYWPHDQVCWAPPVDRCRRCGGPHGVYGPGGSPLCQACVEDLEAWRALPPAERGSGPPPPRN